MPKSDQQSGQHSNRLVHQVSINTSVFEYIIVLAQFGEDLLLVEILAEDVQVGVFDFERVDLCGVDVKGRNK